jgi:hypothetical protein
MKVVAVAPLVVLGAAFATSARAQGPTQLPPPPPPSTAPQYVPPPPPSSTPPAPRRETPSPSPRRREPPPESPPPRRYVAPSPERYEREEAPYARTGFQAAVRTGIALPSGSLTGQSGTGLSTAFKAQVPIFLELGAKVTPSIFLGGFASLGFGGAGNDFRTANGCTISANRSCLATSFHIGVELQYHFQPDARMNPWVGLGLGYESATASASGAGIPSASYNVTGLQFLMLSGGLDFRLSRTFGIGPWLGLDLGQYGHESINSVDANIQNSALHEWFSLGVRGVLYP